MTSRACGLVDGLPSRAFRLDGPLDMRMSEVLEGGPALSRFPSPWGQHHQNRQLRNPPPARCLDPLGRAGNA